MSIRIIYDYNITKFTKQFKLITNNDLFKNCDKIVYYKHNKIEKNELETQVFEIQPHYRYNIYFDNIGEEEFEKLPCDFTILIVNEEYLLKNKYLRREMYLEKKLSSLKDVVNYYFCLSKYSFDILSKDINKSKLILTDGLFENSIYNSINKSSNKYIYYYSDPYSKKDNINILKIWIKYYLKRDEILILNLHFFIEDIIVYIMELLNLTIINHRGIYYYNNIIIYMMNNFNFQFLNNIYASIINHSNYDLVLELHENILYKNFIITNDNIISKEILLDNALYFTKFDEDSIKEMMDTFFGYSQKYVEESIQNNLKRLKIKNRKTIKLLTKKFI